MRHLVAHRKLNRTTGHRRALRRSLVSNLIEHESIITTLPKAKEVKAFAEKLITLARHDTITARRRAIALLTERRIAAEDAEQKTIINKLFKVLGPRFADRPGGYTRIVRLAGRRLGDGTAKAVLQFVDQALASAGVRRRRLTKKALSKDSSSKPVAGQSRTEISQSTQKPQPDSQSSQTVPSDSSPQQSDTASAEA